MKELKQREEEINKFSKERIKIVEGGGVQMKNMLVNNNPFPTTRVQDVIKKNASFVIQMSLGK